jgi:hypothetical protein
MNAYNCCLWILSLLFVTMVTELWILSLVSQRLASCW